MQPINYEKHCAACHPLQFDRRFSEPAPHKEPKVVYDFVAQKLTAYIAAHPSEIPLVDEPDKVLPTRPPQRPARNAQEWVQQRLADAQLLLWRKACKECHTPSYPIRFRRAARNSQGSDHRALADACQLRSRSAPDGDLHVLSHQDARKQGNIRRPDPRRSILPRLPSFRQQRR